MEFNADVLNLVLGTGFVTTFINQAAEWFFRSRREEKNKKQEATYLALKVAVILEAFVIDCANKAATAENQGMPGSRAELLPLPDLQPYPETESWRLIPSDLSTRILSFPNIKELKQQEMDAHWFEGDPEDRRRIMVSFLAETGMHAWNIAVDTRKEYELPEFIPENSSWDPIGHLRSKTGKPVKKS